MEHDKHIFWLSSYLKSGNTWFRIFLANLLHSSNEALELNQVDSIIHDEITTSRLWVDRACGFNTALLTENELDSIKPRVYGWHGREQQKVSYHKTHQAYIYTDNNEPLVPSEGCLGAIHFVRNPLDVAVSLANHCLFSLDDAINMMGDETHVLRHFFVHQPLLSWSMHVKSWWEAKDLDVLLLRYEDMVLDTHASFTKATQFLGLDVTQSMIEKAISHASFNKLKAFEIQHGFIEKPPRVKSFFRKGMIGDWKKELSHEQVQRIIKDHGEMMQVFGYL